MERGRQPTPEFASPSDGVVLDGKYRLISVLGRGGMGTVWRAEHLGLGAPVAIKIIDPTIPSSDEAMRQCRKEARAAAALRSPHVVQVLDFGLDEATHSPFIVMELLDGESLSDRLARVGRMSPADTSRVVTHVARALARAHEAGIVHRDLKPANVFLVRNDDEETAKVLDFGTARVQRAGSLADSGPPSAAVVGTPYYMSPEHITGLPVDHRTDLWALGVMTCECLVGRRPFDGRDIGTLVLQICTYPIPAPSQLGAVPFGFDAWFARATERDPGRRFSSVRELADELRRLCGGRESIAVASDGPILRGSQAASLPTRIAVLGRARPEVGSRTLELPPATAGVERARPGPGSTAPAPVVGPRRGGRAALLLTLLAVVGALVWRTASGVRFRTSGTESRDRDAALTTSPTRPSVVAPHVDSVDPGPTAPDHEATVGAAKREAGIAKRGAIHRHAAAPESRPSSKTPGARETIPAPRRSGPVSASPVESVLDQRR